MSTKLIISCVLLTLVLVSISSAQSVQFDLFPLKLGLRYKYVHNDRYEAYWMGALDVLKSDSGLVTCTVKDSVSLADSAIAWTVEEKSTLWHRDFSMGAIDTAYWIETTKIGELIENLAGSHALRCSLLVWRFPLLYPQKDMYRYADTSYLLLGRGYFPPGPPGTHGYDSLWFSNSCGLYRHRRYSHGSAIGSYSSLVAVEMLGNPTLVQENGIGLPTDFILFQNYPNPFNPSTTIRYGLPERSDVTLAVFNTLGQQVATLVQGEQEAGYHDVTFNATLLASGVYLCRMQAGDFVVTKRLLLVK